MDTFSAGRPRGLTVAAVLMILFGIAEVVTGFTHDFVGVATAQGTLSTTIGATLGIFYLLSGVFILTMKKQLAALAILLLMADVTGRIFMVVAGLFPVDTFKQIFSIVVGTVVAGVFAIYIGLRWRSFRA